MTDESFLKNCNQLIKNRRVLFLTTFRLQLDELKTDSSPNSILYTLRAFTNFRCTETYNLHTIPSSWHCIGAVWGLEPASGILHGHALVSVILGCLGVVPCPVLAALHLLTLLTAGLPAFYIFMSYRSNPSNCIRFVVWTVKEYAWIWITYIWKRLWINWKYSIF